MALSRVQKEEAVADLNKLFSASKLTVFAKYPGTSVKSMQALRAQASQNGTTVKVAKNRLVKRVLSANDSYKSIDTSAINGPLMYAFNDQDEVAPAQVLAAFSKNEPQIEFVGAITAEGQLLSAEDVKALAALPTKEQLRAQLVGTLAAPLSGFVNVLSGNVRGILNILSARADQLS